MSDAQMLAEFNARVQGHVRSKLQLWSLYSGNDALLRQSVPRSLQPFIIPHIRDDQDLTDAEMQILAEWGQQEVLEQMKAENAERRSGVPAHMTRQDPLPSEATPEPETHDMTWWWIGGGLALLLVLIIVF